MGPRLVYVGNLNMRRQSALAVLLALVAAVLVPLAGSPSSATTSVASIDYSGSKKGTFSTDPAEFTKGDKVKLAGNFPDSSANLVVTFYKETSPGSNNYDSVGTDESNQYGNAYFLDYQVDAKQRMFARTSKGLVTELDTLDPKIPPDPDTCSTAGTLTSNPAFITTGSKVQLWANYENDQSGAKVDFYKKGAPNVLLGSTTANSSGNAYLKDFEVQGAQEVFAISSRNICTPTLNLTPGVVAPEDFATQDGALTGPTGKVYDGRKGSFGANFPNGTRDIVFFVKDGSEWDSIGQVTSNSSGDAVLANYQLDGDHEYFAGSADKQHRTNVLTYEPLKPNEGITGGPSTLGGKVIYVTTDSAGTPSSKGVDYEGKAVLTTNGTPTDTLDLETIAVRGNSTADKPKKPYKFKFEDKQSPFGMPEDKTWVLLANYMDWSLVRSMVAWDLGSIFVGPMKWFPRSQFAELFINGKYIGSYQLAESIKIKDERVDVKPKWGQIIENDPHWKDDGVPGFVGKSGMNYAWKDPDEFKTLDEDDCDEVKNPTCEDPEGLTNVKIDMMKKKIQDFETVLYGADNKKDWSKVTDFGALPPAQDWTTYLDMDSAVDYYITREFTKDNDADFYRSNFFHIDDVRPESTAKFFMGPIWDFDRSAGSNTSSGTSNSSPTGWWIRGNGSPNHDTNKIHWFTRIAKDPRFLNKLHDRWAVVRGEMQATFVGDGTGRGPAVSRAVTKLGGKDDYALGQRVAANDRAAWKGSGSRFDPRSSTYAGELEWLRTWYKDRFNWMDTELKKTPPPIP